MPREEETQLVAQCLAGDTRAQEKLFSTHYNAMMGICLRYTTDRDAAQDILQDGFVKIFGHLSEVANGGNLIPWMRRVMINTAIDRYRRTQVAPKLTELDDLPDAGQAPEIVEALNHEDLLACLTKLPPGYRMVFNMYAVEGFSHKEIGEHLGITEGTSKSQLSKARIFLQRLVSKLHLQAKQQDHV